jgi:hypothetical protein
LSKEIDCLYYQQQLRKKGEIIKEILGKLSSTAYDKFRKEADIAAADYLVKAKMVSGNQWQISCFTGSKNHRSAFSWIATHPESKERAKYI